MNEELRNKIEKLLGTAILKNDKNYTDDMMKVFEEWLAAHDTEVRIDELLLLSKAIPERTNTETWEQWSWRVADCLKDRLASLRGKGEAE